MATTFQKIKILRTQQNSTMRIYIESKRPLTIDCKEISSSEIGDSTHQIVLLVNNPQITINGREIIIAHSIRHIAIDEHTFYLSTDYKELIKTAFKVPLLVGHRGMGRNRLNADPKYRENTIASFNDAFKNNTHWVEFDVNVTKEDLPVIYHNFKLNDKLIIDMANEEFLSADPYSRDIKDCNISKNKDFYKHEISEYKYCTLKDVFTKCDSVGFNIEIKYPMESEKIRYGITGYKNIDLYLKPILDVIMSFNKDNIFMSSFHIDVCIFLQFVQWKYDVFYLFDGEDIVGAIGDVVFYDFAGLVIDSCRYKEDYVLLLHNYHKLLFVYGYKANEKEWVDKFLAEKGDGIITDKINDVISCFSKYSA